MQAHSKVVLNILWSAQHSSRKALNVVLSSHSFDDPRALSANIFFRFSKSDLI